jgi:hypothetical protein
LSLCIAAGAASLVMAMQSFTLVWTHSVERTEWRESWRVTPAGLMLTEARVKGSGAGMEPATDAVWIDGWFAYRPNLQPVTQLRLAVSDATGEGWRLCSAAGCRDLESLLPTIEGGEVVLSACTPENRR